MSLVSPEERCHWYVFKRQLAACAAFAFLFAIIVAILYWQERRREWTLRTEQAKHRLDVAFELISRELDRVRADALFLADQAAVQQFAGGDASRRAALEAEYVNFVRRKATYDQIRLLDLNGRETIRVNYADQRPTAVDQADLQDKADRYYYREALALQRGEVVVSEFDLNLEHGQIEQPLKPVIRFVTPVVSDGGAAKAFLVLNYLGARLLRELDDPSLPGTTILLRPDGHYLRSHNENDAWGWQLGHDRTFARQFPNEWAGIEKLQACELTDNGAFAARRIVLGKSDQSTSQTSNGALERDSIILVAFLPRSQVFVASSELLWRLLLLAGCIFVPLAIFTRYWAHATASRVFQSRRIVESEERLRELSSRLLRIQEDERRAISREIHDELGQQVTAISLDIKLADRNLDSGQAKPHLQRAIHESSQLLQTLHAFATRVRPDVLDDLGLRDAVESHLWEFQKRTNITVDATLAFQSDDVPDEIADNAYRLLQESLNNVIKHADAARVTVHMEIDRNEPKRLTISICDDGRGYDESESNGSRLGLVGMQERVDLLSGELQIQSSIDDGTRVEITLPLRERIVEPTEKSV